MEAKLVIFSAPSGAGKTTIVRAMLDSFQNLEFSISACSRPKRENEVDGLDYYFLGVEGFKKKIEEDAFLEWEEVYRDHFYGTLKSEVTRIGAKDHYVIFDVDVYGGLNIKRQFGSKALAIFIMPPSVEALEDRLRKRSTDTNKNIQKRMDKARHEISKADEFDKIIINDELNDAIDEAKRAVSDFLNNE
ncbi:MAG: guanylate kinase [Bacteroidetes bacterium]|nr:MAG: guanylate kinase [Bacteroidota bacterium]